MKVLDLFSGIGGFSLGLERAGFETVAFCEIDQFCRQVLAKHWPDVPIFEDVTKLRGEDVGPVDVICGGYPCQPFSLAGERKGAEDDRHLWPEFMRLVAELRSTWVIGENVAGHISMGLDDVLSDLENAGYACRSFVIPACAVDAQHKRSRIWTIAHTNNPRQQSGARSGKDNRHQSRNDAGRLCEIVSNTASKRIQGRWPVRQQEPKAYGEKALSVCGSTGLRAREWATEPSVGRVAHGVPNRVDRIKALGNAVVPQIPEILGNAILAAHGESE